jgi:CRISPR-associated exonuclease Cas4
VTPLENPKSQIADAPEREALPLSLLNDFLYCPRRAALKTVEGWREENRHTILGDIAHEHADLAGYESQISDSGAKITLLRALPVWSDRLGLSGKCDIVEVERSSTSTNLKSEISDLKSGGIAALRPVEYKKGKRRQFQNDDAQLCAQALCLEEMFGVRVERGAVFHAASKRRRDIEFTAELRRTTEDAIGELHAMLREAEVANSKFEIPKLPPAVFKPACEECSLFEVCLPKITCAESRAGRLSKQSFQI